MCLPRTLSKKVTARRRNATNDPKLYREIAEARKLRVKFADSCVVVNPFRQALQTGSFRRFRLGHPSAGSGETGMEPARTCAFHMLHRLPPKAVVVAALRLSAA